MGSAIVRRFDPTKIAPSSTAAVLHGDHLILCVVEALFIVAFLTLFLSTLHSKDAKRSLRLSWATH